MSWTDYLAILGALGGMLMIVGFPVLRFTLTRRLEKELQKNCEYLENGGLESGFVSTALIAWACILPYVQSSAMFQNIYPGLDVKSFANRFEKSVAYATV